jgi:hypothetical protein
MLIMNDAEHKPGPTTEVVKLKVRKLGALTGQNTAPRDIDNCNDEILHMFLGEAEGTKALPGQETKS